MGSFTTPSSDGVTLVVHDLGGSGHDALFAHATGFPFGAYRPLLDQLSPLLRVGGPELRGIGGSSWPTSGSANWQGFADDLRAAGAALGFFAHRAPLGIGHSSGATALLLVEAAQPGTFSALYCYEPAYFPAGAAGLPAATTELLARRVEGARRRRPGFPSRDEARARLAASPLGLAPEALEAYLDSAFETRSDGALVLRLAPEQEAAIYAAAPAAAAGLAPSAVRCPVHLVAGAASDPISRSGTEALANQLAHASTEIAPGLPHLGPLVDPAALAASIRAWAHAALGDSTRDCSAGEPGGFSAGETAGA